MTLTYIMATTLFGGLASVLLAAGLSAPLLSLIVRHLVSLSTGVLLGTALLHVLPEAFESQAGAHELFIALLGGLLFFWLLEKPGYQFPSQPGLKTTYFLHHSIRLFYRLVYPVCRENLFLH